MSLFTTILVIFLLFMNIFLIILYLSEKRSSRYVAYDEESRSTLKRRVTHLKEELESELVDFDIEEWEKALEESLEEEIKNL
ncbi:MAG TPA: hypothetical protein HA302_05955 [Thermococcaceae archaeon]|uniref:Uncharacterized protein n=1 Tax=Thermococcus sibiricus (strain DSM 12597 / MM 739) TaxID=604354 RepID=C6A299_THESM|nr:hypothetical protein [Thermococcus sibiricus]ACS89744.1 hypothetical protein TSIB_0679 [Thermococcus sibiricus MM 739]KUK28533.1 MAG: Uncharacterized protein XD61_0920 [Thermococcus sp. 40_45]HII67533.1 hypothetical protein [Thermococcaceae archaeon]